VLLGFGDTELELGDPSGGQISVLVEAANDLVELRASLECLAPLATQRREGIERSSVGMPMSAMTGAPATTIAPNTLRSPRRL